MVISRTAQIDLQEIEDHIARDAPRAAHRLISELYRRIERLGADAEAYGHHPHLGPPLHRFEHKSYLVFYDFDDTSVNVIGAVFGGRDLAEFFDRRLGPR